jgi:hypothetical protein
MRVDFAISDRKRLYVSTVFLLFASNVEKIYSSHESSMILEV